MRAGTLASLGSLRRAVVCGTDDAARVLWETLVSQAPIDVVALVDPDSRREGRPTLGAVVREPSWLKHADWDVLLAPSSTAGDWRLHLQQAGVDPGELVEIADAGSMESLAAAIK